MVRKQRELIMALTRYDIYGHEVEVIEYHLKEMPEGVDKEEIKRVLEKVKQTDAGPLPRGKRLQKHNVTESIYYALKQWYRGDPHVEVQKSDKTNILLFVRVEGGPIESFAIKVTQPWTS